MAGDYVAAAAKAVGELYCYGHSNVPFKPTKAKDVQFRPNANQAMSYFVGAKAVSDGIPEDGGFAINGGKGWSEVVFDNHQIDCHGSVAIAMAVDLVVIKQMRAQLAQHGVNFSCSIHLVAKKLMLGSRSQSSLVLALLVSSLQVLMVSSRFVRRPKSLAIKR